MELKKAKKPVNIIRIVFILGLIMAGVIIVGFLFFSDYEVLDAEVYQAKFTEDDNWNEYDVELENPNQYDKFMPDYSFDLDIVSNADMGSQEAWVLYGKYNQYIYGIKLLSNIEAYIDTYESKKEALDRKEYLLKNLVSNLSPNYPVDSKD